MRVIGFTGEARHGKDTAANMLAEYLRERGESTHVTAWANKLKVSAARALGFEGPEDECIALCDRLKVNGIVSHSFTDEDGTPYGYAISGRKFLEFLGTEGGRDVHGPNVWVDLALPKPVYADGVPKHVATTVDWHIDTTTRFDSEVARIREWGGWIIRVERPSVDNGLDSDAHMSRAGIPRAQCDATIINDGTLEDLRRRTIMAFESLTGVDWQAGTVSDEVAARAEVVVQGRDWNGTGHGSEGENQ